jgi:hypothetical protein
MGSVTMAEYSVLLVVVLLYAFPLWRIARKMGYPGAVGILACVPGVSLIVAYVAAFSEWPVQRELESLRRQQG